VLLFEGPELLLEVAYRLDEETLHRHDVVFFRKYFGEAFRAPNACPGSGVAQVVSPRHRQVLRVAYCGSSDSVGALSGGLRR
jgi:hypothetical protein